MKTIIGDIFLILALLLWPAMGANLVNAIRDRTITVMPRFVCERDREYLKKTCTYPRDSDPVNYWGYVVTGLLCLLLLPAGAVFALADLWHRL